MKTATKNTLYHQFVAEWFSFYEARYERPRKFGGVDGKCIKELIGYFGTLCAGDEEKVLNSWKVFLRHWKYQDAFHQKNTDLKYINSKINILLDGLKRIIDSRKQGNAKGISNEYVEQVLRDLQS